MTVLGDSDILSGMKNGQLAVSRLAILRFDRLYLTGLAR